jgi:hypothetical protein
MAVLAIFSNKGVTQKMYDALRKEIELESKLPLGGVLHACGFDENGDQHVADVWESQELLDAFVHTRLIPAMKKLGIPLPTVSVYPAAKVYVYPAGATNYSLK